MEALLNVKGLSRGFDVRTGFFKTSGKLLAVDKVYFDLKENETLGLVGESGCGKSTLAKLILMLLEPDEGSVCFDGIDIYNANAEERKKIRRGMQVVFQDPFGSLNPRKRIISTVEEPLLIHAIGTKKERRERALELLGLVGLSPDMAQRFPHEFSGGQRQRICIARALAVSPKLLICDEPVSALDVSIQAQVLNLIADLQEKFRLSSIFISHDLSVVGYVSDRIAVMYKGRIIELAGAQEIMSSPLHPYTRILLASAPVIGKERKHRIMPINVTGDEKKYIQGCSFSPLCPGMLDMCVHEKPELKEWSPGHFAACWLA